MNAHRQAASANDDDDANHCAIARERERVIGADWIPGDIWRKRGNWQTNNKLIRRTSPSLTTSTLLAADGLTALFVHVGTMTNFRLIVQQTQTKRDFCCSSDDCSQCQIAKNNNSNNSN